MNTSACPFLGAMDEAHNQETGIDYPSFENRCFADAGTQAQHKFTPLMLADQATYCLSGQHQLCPRFQASQRASALYRPQTHEPSTSIPLSSDINAPGVALAASVRGVGEHSSPGSVLRDSTTIEPDELAVFADTMVLDGIDDPFDDGWRSRRSSLWLGAVSTFIFVFLCGISMALYTGWQLVTNNLLAAQPARGAVTTLNARQASTPQVEAYVVVTATSEGVPVAAVPTAPTPTPTVGAVLPQPTPVPTYPQAVTPTPLPADGEPTATLIQVLPVAADGEQSRTRGVVEDNPGPQVVTELPADVPPDKIIVVVPPTPTERPTPNFDIPLSAPLPEVAEVITATVTIAENTTPTPTPTATLGQHFVIFKADEGELNAFECTTIRWEVRNVLEVFYEDRGVFGSGEEEACIRDEDEDFDLVVRLGDGTTKHYTTTIALILPTATPEPTATFTPIPIPTATWTPDPPTATPTPDIQRSVTLAVASGNSPTCRRGAICEIGLMATNTGSGDDDIAVVIAHSTGLSPQLCRTDGVCSAERLVFTDLGPTFTANATFRVTIPTDATQSTVTYDFRAISVRSGEATTSEDVRVEIQIQ